MKNPHHVLGLALLSLVGASSCHRAEKSELPNILWLVSEDNSPFAGCYGDTFATTPNMDKLASQGFLYTHAYANAPVCAPARNTIITGVYANSAGNQHMRSTYLKSDIIRFFPEYLRDKGYYCTNNAKEDYNIDPEQTKGIWDESSQKATYKNRKPGQPFFAVFNCGISHESSIHKSIPASKLRHNPDSVTLPPYHPDTPEMRHDWAQYYDKVEDMDQWLGEKLKELDDAGLADNTIVFYYGDNGGVLGRSKRFVYETGTRIPFIVRIPQKYKDLFPSDQPGSKINRLISFVDLAPTLLSICHIPVPGWMQGHAFLGPQKTDDPQYAYMFRGRMDERYDMSRAVRDKQYRYIRNFMPYRIYGQHINYLWRAPSMRSWEKAYNAGKCDSLQSAFWKPKPVEELYDTEHDPWEVENLAGDGVHNDVLLRMRKANKDWMKEIYDAGVIPEAQLIERAGDTPIYDYMRSDDVPFDEILEAANICTLGKAEFTNIMINCLHNDDGAIRYWGATGLLILGEKARPWIPNLETALKDSSADVVVVAAEALYYLGEKEEGLKAMLNVLNDPNEFARLHALNAIDFTGESTPEVKRAVIRLYKQSTKEEKDNAYDQRLVTWLFDKWGIDPKKL